MALKFYAVKEGRKTGIFDNWDECKKQVEGFKGASYKSFKSYDEAKNYLNPQVRQLSMFKTVEIYVDGSFNSEKNIFGSGIVILNDGNVKEVSLTNNDSSLVSMRNVAGEIKAAEYAMQYAVDNSIPEFKLYYDYEGIEKWCTGVWKTNKERTANYKKYYDSIKNKVKVIFIKVDAHTGVMYNELADKLAKLGAEI